MRAVVQHGRYVCSVELSQVHIVVRGGFQWAFRGTNLNSFQILQLENLGCVLRVALVLVALYYSAALSLSVLALARWSPSYVFCPNPIVKG